MGIRIAKAVCYGSFGAVDHTGAARVLDTGYSFLILKRVSVWSTNTQSTNRIYGLRKYSLRFIACSVTEDLDQDKWSKMTIDRSWRRT